MKRGGVQKKNRKRLSAVILPEFRQALALRGPGTAANLTISQIAAEFGWKFGVNPDSLCRAFAEKQSAAD